MKLKKASEEEQSNPEPVSFRLPQKAHDILKVIAEALGKSKSQVVEEVIYEAFDAVAKDYPKDVKAAAAKLKISVDREE